jgi:hypothetical protein
MGQRSIVADSIEEPLEVILNSGNFCDARLARRDQVWLVTGVLYKAGGGAVGYFLFHEVRELAREFAS